MAGRITMILICRYGLRENHEKSGWADLKCKPSHKETPGNARLFISDQSKEVSQDYYYYYYY